MKTCLKPIWLLSDTDFLFLFIFMCINLMGGVRGLDCSGCLGGFIGVLHISADIVFMMHTGNGNRCIPWNSSESSLHGSY